MTSNRYVRTERISSESRLLRRLYELLNTGKPQVLMVKAGTGRHFVTVVGYKAGVESADSLQATDLLIIDSYDGKLESMDPEIYPSPRVLHTQHNQYRL